MANAARVAASATLAAAIVTDARASALACRPLSHVDSQGVLLESRPVRLQLQLPAPLLCRRTMEWARVMADPSPGLPLAWI